MNPLKCKQLATEHKKLQKQLEYLEKQNTIQALKILELTGLFDRERESHLLTLYTIAGMLEQVATLKEFKANWASHVNTGINNLKGATREQQNAYLAKWGVVIEEEELK